MKRVFTIFILMMSVVWVMGQFGGGTGEEGDPYLVENAAQLNEVRNHLGAHFEQTQDIDLTDYTSGNGWLPIGPFTGQYDGAENKITSLFINRTSADNIGLFSTTAESAVLKNIVLEEVSVTGRRYVGALVGVNNGAVIECISDGGNVTATYTISSQGGGLVGVNNGSLTDSSSSSIVSTGGREAGGLVGRNNGSITNCHAAGSVTANTREAGGLVGYNEAGNITDSSATGNVTAPNYRVGGLVGYFNNGAISGSHAAGNATGSERVGGLVGKLTSSGSINDSYATGDAESTASFSAPVGGLVGTSIGPVSRSFASGTVTAAARDAGGLIGFNNGGTVTECYAVGSVSGTRDVGGLVGRNVTGDITDSFAVGSVSSPLNVGGLVGTLTSGGVIGSYYDEETTGQNDEGKGMPRLTEDMKIQGTFENWDFDDVWDMSHPTNSIFAGYPVLQWQEEPSTVGDWFQY